MADRDHMKGRIQADLERRGLGNANSGIDYDRETNTSTLRMRPEQITPGHREMQRDWNWTVGNRETYGDRWQPNWPDPPRVILPNYGC